MSIKGNFSDISFAELLKVISKYDGRLGIWNFQEKKQYECFFQNNNVVYLNINGQNISDGNRINSFISEISADKTSYYAFQKDAVLDSKPQISIAVGKMLSSLVLSNVTHEEIERLLPNPLTKFEIVPEFSDVAIGDLRGFWDLAAAHFQAGCSALDLAELFGIDIKDVQTNFYKLRTIKAIRPVRLFKINKLSAKSGSAGSNLKRLVNLKEQANPPQPASHPHQTSNTVETIAENSVSLLHGNFSQSLPVEEITIETVEETSLSNPPLPDGNEADLLNDFELDKVVDLPQNEFFVNKYLPAENTETQPETVSAPLCRKLRRQKRHTQRRGK